MQVFIKVALSVAIILVATAIGKKLPATAGSYAPHRRLGSCVDVSGERR